MFDAHRRPWGRLFYLLACVSVLFGIAAPGWGAARCAEVRGSNLDEQYATGELPALGPTKCGHHGIFGFKLGRAR